MSATPRPGTRSRSRATSPPRIACCAIAPRAECSRSPRSSATSTASRPSSRWNAAPRFKQGAASTGPRALAQAAPIYDKAGFGWHAQRETSALASPRLPEETGMEHGTNLRRATGLLALLAVLGLGGSAALAQSPTRPADRGLQVLGDEPSYLDLGAGAFDMQGHRASPTSAEGRVEFRYGQKFLYLGPAAGLLVNTRGGVFG